MPRPRKTSTCRNCGDLVTGEPCTVASGFRGPGERLQGGMFFACDCGEEWEVSRRRRRTITDGNGEA